MTFPNKFANRSDFCIIRIKLVQVKKLTADFPPLGAQLLDIRKESEEFLLAEGFLNLR